MFLRKYYLPVQVYDGGGGFLPDVIPDSPPVPDQHVQLIIAPALCYILITGAQAEGGGGGGGGALL